MTQRLLLRRFVYETRQNAGFHSLSLKCELCHRQLSLRTLLRVFFQGVNHQGEYLIDRCGNS